MFEFALSDEQRAVVDLAAVLASDVVDPAARQAESERAVPASVWRRLLETGLVAPVAEEHGGEGVPDALTQALLVEGIAKGDAAITAAATWSGGAALVFDAVGTAEQRAALLPAFVSDPSVRGAVALHEGYGRAPSELKTAISASGDGTWKVQGRKAGVAFGESAAPLIVVGVDPADGRLRAAVLSGSDPGVTVISDAPHLGLDAANLATLQIDTVFDADQLVGGIDADPEALARVVARLRLLTAAVALGSAQRAREYASEYATERIAFGQPISSFQGVSFMLADAQMHLDAARLGMWEVLTVLDAAPVPDLERMVSLAVNEAGEVASSVARNAVQVLGGHGFITDHPVERWYRATAGLSSMDFDPSCSPLTISFSS